MKSLVKKVIFIIFGFLSNFIIQKKDFTDNKTIVILLKKPLGLGDIVMLSPFLKLIEQKFNDVYVLSEYPMFLDLNNIKWQNNIDKKILNNALVISPTLALTHLKYMFKAKYFIGYFFSNKLVSNISKINYIYNPKNEHYLKKTFFILDILNIKYNKDDFEYLDIKIDKFDIKIDNYIVIASYSNWLERQYKKEKYIKLIKDLLNNSDEYIVLIGSNDNDEIKFNYSIEQNIKSKRVINLTGKTTILQMNYIIKEATKYIGNDSGPSNIAYIIAKKVVVFFGCVDANYRIPINKILKSKIIVFNNQKSCNYFSCYDGYVKPKCKNIDKYSCLDTDINYKILDK